jgi:quercetin 2,3-dioxygenase
MQKIIEAILKRPANYGMVGDGFRVYNYFPNGYRIRESVSPFLMLDYNPEFNFGPSSQPRGVGSHPHKGFETVTIAYKGRIAHHDSKGNSGVINPGEVQWMTAGEGILHKEYHEETFSKTGGPFEMVQLWVNLPKANKLAPAGYQSITNEQMAKVLLDNNGGVVNVIAGNCNSKKGPAKTYSEMNVWDMHFNKGGSFSCDVPANHNTCLLIIEGSLEINGKNAMTQDFVLFKKGGEAIQFNAKENSKVLLLSGAPINEPIAQYGPFVMNTQQEIYEAMEEFNSGKFGHLD